MGKAADAEFDPIPESAVVSDGSDDGETRQVGIDAAVVCRMTEKGGNPVTLVDYASAGKDWTSDIAAWLRCPAD